MNQEDDDTMADVRAGWRRSQMHAVKGGKKDGDKPAGPKPKLRLIKGEKK